MATVKPRGDINSPIWFIVEPTAGDFEKGIILSGGTGYVFDKILNEASIPTPYILPFYTDDSIPRDNDSLLQAALSLLTSRSVPIIVPMGYLLTGLLVPQTKSKKKPFQCSLDKYAGSILTSQHLTYPHYIIPSQDTMFVIMNWYYRDIMISIDLGHVREEYEYWVQHKTLNPLPIRKLVVEPSFAELMEILNKEFLNVPYVSTDIETVRAPAKSPIFRGHCGYPYTISLASSPSYAVSLCIWDYSDIELVAIWRALDVILRTIPQIGQNYFNFDAHLLEGLGFKPCLDKCQDTMIRHHILWPEFEHKLQFLTKQYTREPYYKDEGKHWSPKYKTALMRYNCLDTTVTYEVFLGQEKDFAERPHLK